MYSITRTFQSKKHKLYIMVTYDSAEIYIQSCTSLRAKITAIDEVVDVLMTTVLKAAARENVSQYSLNNGQTVINTTYRSTKEVIESIKGFEAIREMYVNRLNGRVVRLVDSKN